MLLRFGIENFGSIRDWHEFSLISSSQLKDDDTGLVPCEHSPSGFVVPFALLMGANASGKSTLLSALDYVCRVVKLSHGREENEPVPYFPFALNVDGPQRPTRTEVDFVVHGTRYHYGFSATKAGFDEEWLYDYNVTVSSSGKTTTRRRKIFERKDGDIAFGASVRGERLELHYLKRAVRSNSLLLSTAAANNREEFVKISEFFRNVTFDQSIASLAPGEEFYGYPRKESSPQIDPRVIVALGNLSTGIVESRLRDMQAHELPFKVPTEDDHQDMNFGQMEFAHERSDGKVAWFRTMQESSGTRRLIQELDVVFRALDSGALIVIDELSASLHLGAAAFVLALFSDRQINKNGAQLIATTHSASLWQQEFIRRDQIWFAEKGVDGASEVFPLSDIKGTRKHDDFLRDYIEGRYGALPFSGDARTFVATQNALGRGVYETQKQPETKTL